MSELKTLEEIEKIIQENRKELKEKYGLKKIGVFGSYVRGEQNRDSDIDILIEVERHMGFIKFLNLKRFQD
jgi:predicted nucleotidyltransferase